MIMIAIIETVAGLFVFSLLVAPIVMMSILLMRTRKPKNNPQQHIKLEQLEQNDYTIVDDVNKAFSDVSQSLTELQGRLDDIEEKLEREENTVKGFSDKRQK
jgi:predicted  nucleic acid-binding Zn-ribbon protein